MARNRGNSLLVIFMDIETKMSIIKSDPLEEIVTEGEMRNLLETNSSPKHYIGYEISGLPHIGTIVAAKKILDLDKIGVKTQVLLADWHSMANNKMGGDWDRILKLAEVFKKIFERLCPNTRIVLGSELYKGNDEYWKMLIQMSRRLTMARATRTLIIEGRSQKDTLHVSQYIYPVMQAADIWALDVDIPHAGMDQRRVHMLAKEIFPKLGLKNIVPIHHHLLPSLAKPPEMSGREKEEIVAEMKMSKSKPGSFIGIFQSDEEIDRSINKAWCPEREAAGNPLLEICRYLIIPFSNVLKVERKNEHGGDVEYAAYSELEKDFTAGKIGPQDLKPAVAEALKRIIKPLRGLYSAEQIKEFVQAQGANS